MVAKPIVLASIPGADGAPFVARGNGDNGVSGCSVLCVCGCGAFVYVDVWRGIGLCGAIRGSACAAVVTADCWRVAEGKEEVDGKRTELYGGLPRPLPSTPFREPRARLPQTPSKRRSSGWKIIWFPSLPLPPQRAPSGVVFCCEGTKGIMSVNKLIQIEGVTELFFV